MELELLQIEVVELGMLVAEVVQHSSSMVTLAE